jgi:hypothetical protein
MVSVRTRNAECGTFKKKVTLQRSSESRSREWPTSMKPTSAKKKKGRLQGNKFCTDKLLEYCTVHWLGSFFFSPSDVSHERITKMYSFPSTCQYFAPSIRLMSIRLYELKLGFFFVHVFLGLQEVKFDRLCKNCVLKRTGT